MSQKCRLVDVDQQFPSTFLSTYVDLQVDNLGHPSEERGAKADGGCVRGASVV
jgi:hypothetical protein